MTLMFDVLVFTDSKVKGESRPEAMIRFGQISREDVATDDDVFIVIAPQNGMSLHKYLKREIQC